ncbi:MAG TPA: BTAD domain-containing putative transcriptional regulator, partial [Anaerolineae bacterium]|nr:BTAD domain-containing putative transcriptional regulator [Anaerolineae bacterium]
MFSFLLLGAPQILKEGRAIQLPRRKNRALLFYVAAHDKPLTREHLLNFFFPDHERAAAQPILRTMLYDLRKQLDDALIVQDETLALAPDTFVDARAFQSNLQPPTFNMQYLTSSLQLYRGDFLDGLTLPDEPQFDDWVNRERERYRALATRGWNKLAALYEDAREYGGALDALERALALDALNEEIQRAAMRVQYFRGDRAGAIRRFEQLQNRLNEELGVPPLPETRALYDAIVTDALVADSRWQMADSRPLDFARGKLPTEDGGRRVRKSITKP